MKNLSWKKIAIAIMAVGLAIAGIFYFKSGSDEQISASYINPAFAEHISSYTTRVISSESPLRIVMTSDLADSTRVGEEIREKLFDFTPSVYGKAVWVDERTVEFQPESRMSSGK